eukprot:TRINITY_DN29926_c0_g1_i1.p1 TRINITY_DN29926_c0_g1~~TRINITY_DN29926_c0_g1_i1.p1  ORF type:complete len:703 (+),score=118.94 TRINITY_DN29926_c0_g1_i1:259-2367(+)
MDALTLANASAKLQADDLVTDALSTALLRVAGPSFVAPPALKRLRQQSVPFPAAVAERRALLRARREDLKAKGGAAAIGTFRPTPKGAGSELVSESVVVGEDGLPCGFRAGQSAATVGTAIGDDEVRLLTDEALSRAYFRALASASALGQDEAALEAAAFREQRRNFIEGLVGESVGAGLARAGVKANVATEESGVGAESETASSSCQEDAVVPGDHHVVVVETQSYAPENGEHSKSASLASEAVVAPAEVPAVDARDSPRGAPRRESSQAISVLYGGGPDAPPPKQFRYIARPVAPRPPRLARSGGSAARASTARHVAASPQVGHAKPGRHGCPASECDTSRTSHSSASRSDSRAFSWGTSGFGQAHSETSNSSPRRSDSPLSSQHLQRQHDQELLQRRFHENLQRSRGSMAEESRRLHVLQEYHWLMQDTTVEKRCRDQEEKWRQRELERRERVRRQQTVFLAQSKDELNRRYGRMLDISTDATSTPLGRASDKQSSASNAVDESAQAEAAELDEVRLDLFLQIYRDSVRRKIVEDVDEGDAKHASVTSSSMERPAPPSARGVGVQDVAAAGTVDSSVAEVAEAEGVSALVSQRRRPLWACLSPGRAAFVNKRNPWAKSHPRQGRLPPVRVSAILESKSLTEDAATPRPAGTAKGGCASGGGGTCAPPLPLLARTTGAPVMPRNTFESTELFSAAVGAKG